MKNLNNYLIDNYKLIKENDNYHYENKNKEIISIVKYYDYKIDNFDWILISDIDTKINYRKQGLASKLIDKIYNDIALKRNCGLYLFVKQNNVNAINLYIKLGFKILKKYKIDNTIYYIMIKGNSDSSQFNNMQFGN